MKTVLKSFVSGVWNIATTFMLMAALIALVAYSLDISEGQTAFPDLKATLPEAYRGFVEQPSAWYDTTLNQWYANISGTPTIIDIIDQPLFK